MKHILIVEDDRSTADTMAVLFQQCEGYGVAVAYSVTEAKKELIRHYPDLVLLDYILNTPETGCELLPYLNPETPVLLVTARPRPEAIAEQCRIPYYLAKPFDLDQLTSLVTKLLLNKN